MPRRYSPTLLSEWLAERIWGNASYFHTVLSKNIIVKYFCNKFVKKCRAHLSEAKWQPLVGWCHSAQHWRGLLCFVKMIAHISESKQTTLLLGCSVRSWKWPSSSKWTQFNAVTQKMATASGILPCGPAKEWPVLFSYPELQRFSKGKCRGGRRTCGNPKGWEAAHKIPQVLQEAFRGPG